MLNNVLLSIEDENTERLLNTIFIDQSDKNYPYDALNMYAENATRLWINQTVQNNFTGKSYSIEANEKTPDDFSYPFSVIDTALSRLNKALQLKICAKGMLTVIIDIQYRLIIGQVDKAQNFVQNVCDKFSDL